MMKHLKYEIDIDAPTSIVWEIMVQPEPYKVWVKAFSPNSYFDGEWIQGSKIKFLDPDMGGTKAVLETVEPEKRLLVKHIAIISKEGEVSTSGEMADKWLGTTENYVLTQVGDSSKLEIEIRTHEDFVQMFDDAWPIALASIKELSEKSSLLK